MMTVKVGSTTHFDVVLSQQTRYSRRFTRDEIVDVLAQGDDLVQIKLAKATPETLGVLLIALFDRGEADSVCEGLENGEVLSEELSVELEVAACDL